MEIKKIITDGFKKITDYNIKKVKDNYIWINTDNDFLGPIYSIIDTSLNVLFDKNINELNSCIYIGNNIFKYKLFCLYDSFTYNNVQNKELKALDGVTDIKLYDTFMKVKYQDYTVLTDKLLNPISKKYDSIGEFYGGVAVICNGNKYGVINSSGKEIIKTIYDEVLNIEFDCVTLRLSNEFIIVDKLGNEINRFKINDRNVTNIIYFDNDIYLVRNIKRDYIINSDKKKIYKAKRNVQLRFYPNSHFIHAYNNKRLYSDVIYENGRAVVSFNIISKFYGDAAISIFDNKYGLVNKDFQEVKSHNYSYLEHFISNLFKFSKDNELYGLIDDKGKVTVEDNYNDLRVEYGYIIGTKNNEYDIIDLFGNVLTTIDKKYSIDNIAGDLILLKTFDSFLKNTFFPKFFYKVIYIDGSELIPLVSSKIFLMNNSKLIIDGCLVDLNDEYVDFKYKTIYKENHNIKESLIEFENYKIKKLVRRNK